MTVLQRLKSSLAQQGLAGTAIKVRGALVDRWFDFRFGVDTCVPSELANLTVREGDKAAGSHYAPARVLPLRKLFRSLKPPLSENDVLVDFGSGKGRVLFIAAQFGVREARGVEFASELCEAARKNSARFKARSGVKTEFKTTEADAATYPIAPEENIFVFCNPFEGGILNRVLDNIVASIQQHPRRILIIYYNPRWDDVISRHEEFVRKEELVFWGYRFTLHSNRG